MKTQTMRSVKTHFLPHAFVLAVLVLVVCVIRFASAQRNSVNSINESQLPTLTSDAGIPEGLCQSGIILNGGFETGDFTSWTVDGFNNPPLVTTAFPHMGTFSALAGNLSGPEPFGDSSFYQEFTVPATGGVLSFYHSDFTTDTISVRLAGRLYHR
jgi:hypothetical protein